MAYHRDYYVHHDLEYDLEGLDLKELNTDLLVTLKDDCQLKATAKYNPATCKWERAVTVPKVCLLALRSDSLYCESSRWLYLGGCSLGNAACTATTLYASPSQQPSRRQSGTAPRSASATDASPSPSPSHAQSRRIP